MELREFFKKCMIDFLLIQAGITLSIGIIGCSSSSAGRPDYSILFLPFIYAFFCLLPSFVVYSSKELSLKQMVFRKILQFLLIEAVVVLVSYIAGAFINDSLCVTILLNGFFWGMAHLPLIYFGFNYSPENIGAPWSNMAMMMLVCAVIMLISSYQMTQRVTK